jgi:NAD(P)-dependent dehydrogenase (short-subunit alcohol dehydrogenase family)
LLSAADPLTARSAAQCELLIRINAICPGIIDNPMQRALLRDVAAERGITADQLGRDRNATIPLGRMGSAEEVANVAAFLLSSASSHMTGQSINVSGGMVTH